PAAEPAGKGLGAGQDTRCGGEAEGGAAEALQEREKYQSRLPGGAGGGRAEEHRQGGVPVLPGEGGEGMKRLLPLLALLLSLCACAGEDAAETAAAPADYVGADQAAQAV